MSETQWKVAALFAGIGGVELGLERALGGDLRTLAFCEAWEPAQAVLQARFPGVPVEPDVRTMDRLPAGTTLVTAGFPCTDLSQAGRTVGIEGENSGLVVNVFRLLEDCRHRTGTLPTLLIENVPNMLALDRGRAMAFLIEEIERLGYSWAYRVVDSRFTGVPQRRRRVILVASVDFDPRRVLFADDAGDRSEGFREDMFGFYWTEGRGGLGWAQDAVPTLKGGSTIGIPSPPAVWVPGAALGRRLIKPSIEDAEAMQGFDRGWTDTDSTSPRQKGTRWKMVGNAVTVGVSRWVGSRLAQPSDPVSEFVPWEPGRGSWPKAAAGAPGRLEVPTGISEYPEHGEYHHLSTMVDAGESDVLTLRATRGFWNRLQQGNLGRHPGFRDDIRQHIDALEYEQERTVPLFASTLR
ncbi:DNA (cytosine-5-)-methyltransferase [Pseudactinotalea sp. HY160]|uniref:DNA cytosine methyltransferase n=1 Tax=Pseudactinotalea sp. HY160 TaxID=2654490 RepID=UPI00128B6F14|nr:DNA cytosine methyltransferase [Pseudactinotalea sp. HY160]MPV48964.1 DNA (cytosine-5-)-methyltransferase [Pseudactinotalea sp. HY160]